MINQLEPATGRILISEPFMLDPNFKRSVIYLTQYDDSGATGFVLNNKYEGVFGDIISDVSYSEIPVFTGGPVANDTLHFLHTCPEKIDGGMEVIEGLFWGGDFEQVKEMAQNNLLNAGEVKFFLGYSGWAAGQLEAELSENVWIVAELPGMELIFNQTESELWKQAIRNLGTRYAHIANFPENPMLN